MDVLIYSLMDVLIYFSLIYSPDLFHPDLFDVLIYLLIYLPDLSLGPLRRLCFLLSGNITPAYFLYCRHRRHILAALLRCRIGQGEGRNTSLLQQLCTGQLRRLHYELGTLNSRVTRCQIGSNNRAPGCMR